MGDDEAGRVPVRRQEHLQTALEVGVVEDFRRDVERVVVLGGVEGLAHGGRVLAHHVHLVIQRRHRAVHGQHHLLHGRHGGDHGRHLRQHLRHQGVQLRYVAGKIGEFFGDLIQTVERVEEGSQRPAARDVEAVLFPVEVAANRPEEIIEVGDVVAQCVCDIQHFMREAVHVVGDRGHLRGDVVHALHGVDGLLHRVGLLEHVVHALVHVLLVFDLRGVLHADLERD